MWRPVIPPVNEDQRWLITNIMAPNPKVMMASSTPLVRLSETYPRKKPTIPAAMGAMMNPSHADCPRDRENFAEATPLQRQLTYVLGVPPLSRPLPLTIRRPRLIARVAG